MRKIRVTSDQMAKLTKWLAKNPTATLHEFKRATGGTDGQYYRCRIRAGVHTPDPKLSEGMKKSHAKRRGEEPVEVPSFTVAVEEPVFAKTPEEAWTEFMDEPVKDRVVVEGNTSDYLWYELKLIQEKMLNIAQKLVHLVQVSKERDTEQKKMMIDVMTQNSLLNNQINRLKEKSNGVAV